MAKISCSVCSCAYNSPDKNECTLKTIQVCPCKNCKTGSPEDETCCSSYLETHQNIKKIPYNSAKAVKNKPLKSYLEV